MQTISGRDVSKFSFGAMQFGGTADETAAGEMYAACRAAGVNFFDTAFGYTEGRSERMLGALVAREREDVFVATKCAYQGSAPQKIASEVDESRARLGFDVLDLLYLHRWDAEVPLSTTLEVLARLVSDGVVRYVGVSNFASWQVMKARFLAREMGFEITFLQPMYNLVKRQAEVELLPMAMAEGMVVCPYSPLGGGLLTGKYLAGEDGRLATDDRYAARYGLDWMPETARALATVAKETGVSSATLAVAWAARHKGVWGPIVSARSADQLAPSLEAISFDMDDALYARLSALSPAPPPATDRIEET